MLLLCVYLKASYFGPPHKPLSDNVEYGSSASNSRGVKSMQKTDILCHLAISWIVHRLPCTTEWQAKMFPNTKSTEPQNNSKGNVQDSPHSAITTTTTILVVRQIPDSQEF